MYKFTPIMFVVLAILLLAIITACGGTQAPQTVPVPNGTYTNMVVIDVGPNSTKTVPAELRLKDSVFEIVVLGGRSSLGGYALTKNLMVFVGELNAGEFACTEGQEVGVYTYKYAGQQLVLTRVDDPCLVRELVLVQNAWVKK